MKWAGWRVHTSPLTRLMLCRFPGLSSRIYILFLPSSPFSLPHLPRQKLTLIIPGQVCVCEVVMCLPGKKKIVSRKDLCGMNYLTSHSWLPPCLPRLQDQGTFSKEAQVGMGQRVTDDAQGSEGTQLGRGQSPRRV